MKTSNNMLFLVFIVIFVGLYQNLQACLNEHRALLNGGITISDGDFDIPRAKYNLKDKTELNEHILLLEELYGKSKSLMDYSDLGVLLVYDGQYERAKAIFQEIEKKLPNRYQTATNLGTVYELLGKNDSAYYWIKKGIKLNPHSHEGSEWIHLKILEAKIKAKGDEKYLWSTNILGINFGDGKTPEYKSNMPLDTLAKHIYIQLNERMTFLKPKDPTVAQLLFDLGNAYAITHDVKMGLKVLLMAQGYGYQSDVLTERISYFKRLQAKVDKGSHSDTDTKSDKITLHSNANTFFIVVGGLLSIMIVIFTFWKLKKK